MAKIERLEAGRHRRGAALKAAIFATGLAGIVAEYVMATLASYLLGDAVLQWTLVVSLMLFAMGVGSRVSASIGEPLLDAFITVELALSVLVAISAPLAYLLAGWMDSVGWVIYLLAFGIGFLIGLEIPLVARLNEELEELRVNISAVMERDYYGALVGGVFFAWVGLPILGLTHTPIVLGAVNLLVAIYLFVVGRGALGRPRALAAATLVAALGLAALGVFAAPIVRFGEQSKYRDLVVHAEQSRFQRIVLTRFKDDHWLYLDGHQQLSSRDTHLYHEPLVHSPMRLAATRRSVVVVGGGDGLAVREILRYPEVERVLVLERDPAVTRLAREHPVLRALHGGALDDPRVEVVHGDAYAALLERGEIFDVAILDLPDPRDLALARLYSRPFFSLIARHLSPGGALSTQATSPFFSRKAFLSILATVRASGFAAAPMHNHIPTMGEWGFVVAVRVGDAPSTGSQIDGDDVRRRLLALDWDGWTETVGSGTRFLSDDAMQSMLHFGRGVLEIPGEEPIAISEESDLAVFRYYRSSDWDLF